MWVNTSGLYSVSLWCTVCHYGVQCVTMVYSVSLWCTVCHYGVQCVTMVYSVSLWCTVCHYGVHKLYCMRENFGGMKHE